MPGGLLHVLELGTVLERQHVPRDSTIPRMFEEQLICWTGRDWRNPSQAAEVACRRKIEMSPCAQSRDDTPLGVDTTSATLDRNQTPHWD
jgi:hypothetical protein